MNTERLVTVSHPYRVPPFYYNLFHNVCTFKTGQEHVLYKQYFSRKYIFVFKMNYLMRLCSMRSDESLLTGSFLFGPFIEPYNVAH